MKKKTIPNYLVIASCLFLNLFFSQNSLANGYEIKVKVEGLGNDTIYLGNHYGEKQYVRDTIKLDGEGWGVFKGKDSLPGGIYLIVLPGKTYFEIIVNEQKFTVETDTLDYVQHMKITGSLENKLFNEHQKYLMEKSKQTQAVKARMDANKDNKDSTEILRKLMVDYDKEVKQYRLKLMADHPKTFMAKIIRTMQEPEVPEAPKDSEGRIDSTFQFRYYKSHYLENVDFSDDRLLRTPLFYNKVKTYTQQLTVPMPDSIIRAVDTILIKSMANKEVFKYSVSTLANFYETSNIMGYDKIFVHIAENYYLTDKAYWADSALKAKIHERVMKIKPTILGVPAHDLAMPDTGLKMHSLYGLKAKYTILVFWDPTCSHCKTELPKLSHYYDSARTKGIDVQIFAVGIESDIELWKKFIRDNKLKFLNVSDLYNQTNFRNYYDIYSTPVIYLLDEKKQIIAKRLDTDKIRDFISNTEKRKEEKK
jgi:peroxiredoxin